MAAQAQSWRRIQFSVRLLILLVALSALGLWWCFAPAKGMLSRWQVNRIQPGMQKEQVVQIAGLPIDAEVEGNFWCWYYRVNYFPFAEEELCIDIDIDTGRVTGIYQHRPKWNERR